MPGEGDAGTAIGTGPFVIARRTADRILLERNPHHWKEPARLDAIEFRTGMSASAIASGLRAGEIELARDLLPQDLEAILREPRFRAGLVETPKKGHVLRALQLEAAPSAGTSPSGARSPA